MEKQTIIISPHSRVLRHGKRNPKNYPYWQQLVNLLQEKGYFIIQIGTTEIDKNEPPILTDNTLTNLKYKELLELVNQSYTWISVDNFFHHFCYYYNKPGFVIFGKSDPLIYGHSINSNILKNRKYLRQGQKQYEYWENETYSEECFIEPQAVVFLISKLQKF